MSKEMFLDDQNDRSGYDVYERLVHYRSLCDKLQKENDDLCIQLEEYRLELETVKEKVKFFAVDCNAILQRKLIK